MLSFQRLCICQVRNRSSISSDNNDNHANDNNDWHIQPGVGKYIGPVGRPTGSIPALHRPCRPADRVNQHFFKLALTRTPDSIRPTRRGPDPNRPTRRAISRSRYSVQVRCGRMWSDAVISHTVVQNMLNFPSEICRHHPSGRP